MMSWLHQQFQYNAQMVHSVIKWMIIYHTFNDNAFFFFSKGKTFTVADTRWMTDSMLIVVLVGQSPRAGANNEDNI